MNNLFQKLNFTGFSKRVAAERMFVRYTSLPFKWGNNGGWNCVPSDAKCVGKNRGGVARGALLSSNGRKPFVLKGRRRKKKLFSEK